VYQLAKGHNVESCQGDGNDVVEVHSLAQQAIDKARRGGGPSFLEFKTYRWREHCGPNYDNDLGYRTESEFLEWESRCPIERLKGRLLKEGVLGNQDIDSMVRDLEAEIEAAVTFAKQSPVPEEELLTLHVFAP